MTPSQKRHIEHHKPEIWNYAYKWGYASKRKILAVKDVFYKGEYVGYEFYSIGVRGNIKILSRIIKPKDETLSISILNKEK